MPRTSRPRQRPRFHSLHAAGRNLEIIGEASRKIGPEFRIANPEVPRREMNALRNVLIHNYEAAGRELVWAIVDRDIPPLLETVRRLVDSGQKR